MYKNFIFEKYIKWKFRTSSSLISNKFYSHKINNIFLFNPTIFRYRNKFKLLLRYVDIKENKRLLATFNIPSTENKKKYLIVNEKELQKITFKDHPWLADPRSHQFKGSTFFTCNTGHSESPNKILYFDLKNNIYVLNTKFKRKKIEKNWIFFEHQEKELAIYSHSPKLEIVKLITINSEKFVTKYKQFKYDKSSWEDKYGEIRGGAGLFRYGNFFVSIFQSSIKMKLGLIYNTGILILNKNNLKPIKISKKPILNFTSIHKEVVINKDKLNPYVYKCLYPSGFKVIKEKLTISYGINDYMFGVSELDINKLLRDTIRIHSWN